MITLPDYYDRFDETKNFERHLFLAGPVLQSAELNEVQSASMARTKAIADAIFRDGDIVRDAVVTINAATGVATCGNGVVYIAGAMRGVAPKTLALPLGEVAIGLRLVETIVDADDDASLKDPASAFPNFQRDGAARLKVEAVWAYATDGGAGQFFAIYTSIDRVLQVKTPPPAFNAVTQAIAQYDRESTGGGSYVVKGLGVTKLPDFAGQQVYSFADGAARVNGQSVVFNAAQRITFDPQVDLRTITNEPFSSATSGSQRVFLSFSPIASVLSVSITKEVTRTLTRGAVANTSDPLPDTSVVSITSVSQGGTTYAASSDYTLTGNAVSWAPAGAEPATGSTYSVTYRYITNVAPDSVGTNYIDVTGAVPGTLILTTYNFKLPRIDRICLSESGQLIWVKGVPSLVRPTPPAVPSSLFGLVLIIQTWGPGTIVQDNAVRVVPMYELGRMNDRIDYVIGLIAQQRLESSASLRANGLVKGIFTDPFLDDSLRDAGTPQNAAVYNGIMTLPVTVTPSFAPGRSSATSDALAYNSVVLIQQLAKTSVFSVNPYKAFPLLVPPKVTLNPSVDRWTETIYESVRTNVYNNVRQTDYDMEWIRPYASAAGYDLDTYARLLNLGVYAGGQPSASTAVTTVARQSTTLRQITVSFTLESITPGTTLTSVAFDGVSIPSNPAGPANASGVLTGTFTIPANIPAGTKQVDFVTSGGQTTSARFIGDGTVKVSQSTFFVSTQVPVDPVAETFTLADPQQITGIDLWFTAKGTKPVEVQIRQTTNGLPNRVIMARARVAAANIAVDGVTPTRFTFPAPLSALGDEEYAFVVLSDDSETSLAIAELGSLDPSTGQYVTVQPYQVGVMLSSSNASTWTAHQDRDIAFRLLGASYTQTSKTVNLGTIPVVDMTDLIVRATIDRPTSATTINFTVTLPAGASTPAGRTMVVEADQPIRLDDTFNGNVTVVANIQGTATASPVLIGDVQLVAGKLATSATYVGRSFTHGTSVATKVVVEALLPGTSNLSVAVKAPTDGSWTVLTGATTVAMPDGFTEFTFKAGINSNDLNAVRLIASGGPAGRPVVRNLRATAE